MLPDGGRSEPRVPIFSRTQNPVLFGRADNPFAVSLALDLEDKKWELEPCSSHLCMPAFWCSGLWC